MGALTTAHPTGWLALELIHQLHVFKKPLLTFNIQHPGVNYPTLESGVDLSIVSGAVVNFQFFNDP